ncbi:hypothetical protein T492DRAFT_170729 [Pavlovales sp. CCMP2436]|nr:hypothetical protein T492DRAFT_170729 [Pavlovales sp. CCMP2436]
MEVHASAESIAHLEEIWLSVFSHLDAHALGRCAAVCAQWRVLACEDAMLWRPLCESLWKDKQNMPAERWVRPIVPGDGAASDEAKADLHGGGSEASQQESLSEEAALLVAELESLHQQAMVQPAVEGGAAALVLHEEQYNRFRELVTRLQHVRLELTVNASNTASPNARRASLVPRPHSRAMPVVAPSRGEMREPGQSAAGGSNGGSHGAGAAPTEERIRFELLPWRESYTASLADSKRTECSISDIEGDLVIDFDGSFESARVSSGLFIDDRAFRQQGGRVLFDGERLVLIDIAQVRLFFLTIVLLTSPDLQPKGVWTRHGRVSAQVRRAPKINNIIFTLHRITAGRVLIDNIYVGNIYYY